MGPLDAFWHAANLFAPALCVALLQALAIKLIWRRELGSRSLQQLTLWGAAGGAAATVAALVLLGHDGKMLGYGLLLVGIALPQWWLIIKR